MPALPATDAGEGVAMTVRAEKRFLADAEPARSATELAKTFPKIPALVAHGTRCGKPNCRCTRGDLHPTHYLRWREGTVQRRRYVRASDVPAVRAILEQRRDQRRRERLALAVSMQSWRALAQLIEEYEARVRDDLEEP